MQRNYEARDQRLKFENFKQRLNNIGYVIDRWDHIYRKTFIGWYKREKVYVLYNPILEQLHVYKNSDIPDDDLSLISNIHKEILGSHLEIVYW